MLDRQCLKVCDWEPDGRAACHREEGEPCAGPLSAIRLAPFPSGSWFGRKDSMAALSSGPYRDKHWSSADLSCLQAALSACGRFRLILASGQLAAVGEQLALAVACPSPDLQPDGHPQQLPAGHTILASKWHILTTILCGCLEAVSG